MTREQTGGGETGENPEQHDLQQEHHEERGPARDRVRDPRPEDPAQGIADAGDPDHPRGATAPSAASSSNRGASCEMIEIPADVLRNRISQSAHHCQVPSASLTCSRGRRAVRASEAEGVQPVGRHPSGGFLMKKPPATVTIRNATPRYANVGSTPTPWMSRVATGAVTSAPAAESAHRDPGNQPAMIGKPLHQHRHRNDVAEARGRYRRSRRSDRYSHQSRWSVKLASNTPPP